MKLLKKLLGLEDFESTILRALFDQNVWARNLQVDLKKQRELIDDLKEKLKAKDEEIRQCENRYEETIDRQDALIKQLETQLEHKEDYSGTFYVFNPQKDKPRKKYSSYSNALADAKCVSNFEGGEEIYVLKIVASVQYKEKIKDFALIPDDEIPF